MSPAGPKVGSPIRKLQSRMRWAGAQQSSPATGIFTSNDYSDTAPPDLPGITLSPQPFSHSSLSAVYRGWDNTHRCEVVVKIQRATTDPVAMDRFRREAVVMAQLRHPSIVSLYRFYDGDPAALVMEYVSGQTLAQRVEADGSLSPVQVATIVDSVAAGLDCAHAAKIIHRDVKPANILLPKRGLARLTDFGVAHIDTDVSLTLMGDLLGTIEYASPEQVRGHETPDARSDVYSLAAVAYFALTGTPPFRAADESMQAQLSVMHRQVFADPPPLRCHRENISPQVEAVVLRGLAKAPDDRFQSAGHFAAALQAAAKTGGGTPEQNALFAATRRTGVLAGCLTVAALLIVGGGIWWKTSHAPLRQPSSVLVAARPPVIESLPSLFAVPKNTAPVVAPKLHHAKMRLAKPRLAKPRLAKPRPAKPRRTKHAAVRLSGAARKAIAAAQIAYRTSTRKPHKRGHRLHPSSTHQRTIPALILAAIPAKEAAEPSAPHLRNP